MKSDIMKSKLRWKGDLYILDGAIVGTVVLSWRREYLAYGCLEDWEDTKLGVASTREQAKQKVEEWVEERL